LPKAQQDGVLKAAAAAEPRGWEMSKQREKDADELLAKNGVTVSEPSPELKTALAKIGEQMAAEWEKSAGADGQAILKAYRGK
jgi:TRAP-type C4-dicarboxylate transport system substrate-binding protein